MIDALFVLWLAAAPAVAPRDACGGCAWALDVCLELAVDETLADLRRGAGWAAASAAHRARRAACAESYGRCKVTCQ